MSKKVICFGNIFGNFKKLSETYIKIIEKSGDFDLVILIGKVFHRESPISDIKILKNLNTKFLIMDNSEIGIVAKHKILENHYLIENVILLGRSGNTILEDLRISFINGQENMKFLLNDYSYTGNNFNRNDIETLVNCKDEMKTDILLINSIPSVFYDEIINNPNKSSAFNKKNFSDHISKCLNIIIKKIKPRYIISSIDDFYFERMPYLNSEKFLSRFIHLSYFPTDFKINIKEKFLYALNIKPVNKMWESELINIGDIEYSNDIFKDYNESIDNIIFHKDPYKNVKIIKDEIYLGNIHHDLVFEELIDFLNKFGEVEYLNMINDSKGKFQGYAFAKFKNISLHDKLIKQSNYYSLKGRKLVISEKVERTQTLEDIEKKCWFCINNPLIETELILKELNNFYVAYPKGPITNFHLLIIPKHHIRGFTNLTDIHLKEIEETINIIKKFLNDNNLEYLIYEKNLPYKEEVSKHMVLNILGIDKEISFNLLDYTLDYLKDNKLKFKEFQSSTPINRIAGKDSYYYYIEIPTGIQFGKSDARTSIFVETNNKSKSIFTDYPRVILCNVLDAEERVNWKNAPIDKEFFKAINEKLMKYFK